MITYKSQIPKVHLARENTTYTKIRISSSKDTFQFIKDNAIYEDTMTVQEEIWALYMNRANNLVGISQIGIGDDAGVVGSTKKIFTLGMLLMASCVIIFHNHPSQRLTPSDADKNLCQKIKSAGLIMDIQLIDFIIVSTDEYLSFADDGLL